MASTSIPDKLREDFLAAYDKILPLEERITLFRQTNKLLTKDQRIELSKIALERGYFKVKFADQLEQGQPEHVNQKNRLKKLAVLLDAPAADRLLVDATIAESADHLFAISKLRANWEDNNKAIIGDRGKTFFYYDVGWSYECHNLASRLTIVAISAIEEEDEDEDTMSESDEDDGDGDGDGNGDVSGDEDAMNESEDD
ncbi:hypothetical protein BC937DRAFT_86278 [Endogone sp. FLAS-F59071]|nr:hypothetical protein BC937DRAFT_86278 [Endogone sp. FLAS-F59071]|eukprot:RUS13137.1 hypothetical protein BC937DRAFT_86278 [Endogone sp. FLAS-F59071]